MIMTDLTDTREEELSHECAVIEFLLFLARASGPEREKELLASHADAIAAQMRREIDRIDRLRQTFPGGTFGFMGPNTNANESIRRWWASRVVDWEHRTVEAMRIPSVLASYVLDARKASK